MDPQIANYVTLGIVAIGVAFLILDKFGLIKKPHSNEDSTHHARTESGRFEVPFVSKEMCDMRHQGIAADITEIKRGLHSNEENHGMMVRAVSRLEGRFGSSAPKSG